MSILETIAAATRLRVQKEKSEPLPKRGARYPVPFLFERRLRHPGMSFICEIKKASPSRGVIAEEFPYLHIARQYEEAGAAALSVLTEPDYFLGHNRYLAEIRGRTELPILRKDFIIDPFQVEQSAALGADAVLLICALLTPQELAAYIKRADALGLSCLVEAHDEEEVKTALDAGARAVGVNNRDLKTFEVDTGNSLRLKKLVPSNILFVAESGIRTAQDVRLLKAHGVNAVLVGETLMRAADKSAALDALRGETA